MSPASRTLVFALPEDWRTQPTGGNLYDRFLVQALAEDGADVRVVPFEDAARYAPVYALSDSVLLLDSLFLPRLPRLLAGGRPPAVLLLHYFPSLHSEHDEHERARWQRLEDAVFAAVEGIAVPSEFGRGILEARGQDRGTRVAVVPPALCLQPDGSPRRRDGVHALMVANLTPGKGVREFLQELAAAAGEPRDFELVIAGRDDMEPDYARDCVELIRSHPRLAGCVKFAGPLPLNGLRHHYCCSNLFVSASAMESFGMALQEARAFGLPILALDRGNCREHVEDGTNGHLRDGVADIAGAFLDVVRDSRKHERLLEGAAALRAVENYSWRDAAGRLRRFVTSLPSQSPRTPPAPPHRPQAGTSDHPPFHGSPPPGQ